MSTVPGVSWVSLSRNFELNIFSRVSPQKVKAPGQVGEVRVAVLCSQDATPKLEFLPEVQHTVLVVVENQNLNVEVFPDRCLQVLYRHHEVSIPKNREYGALRMNNACRH